MFISVVMRRLSVASVATSSGAIMVRRPWCDDRGATTVVRQSWCDDRGAMRGDATGATVGVATVWLDRRWCDVVARGLDVLCV